MTDEYWKKPEPQEGKESGKQRHDPGIGIWSRSRVLRIVVWLLVILAVIVVSLVVSAYLAGFGSVFEMIDWIRESAGL
jgi:hypothetical protein